MTRNTPTTQSARIPLARGGAWPAVYLACATLFGLADTSVAETALESRLRARIEAGLTTDSLEVMDERIFARETIRRVYPDRGYRPIWVTEEALSEAGHTLVDWLATVPARHGLKPADYHLDVIGSLEETDRLTGLVDLELAMTDAFLMIGSHLVAGRLNPETLDAEWVANRRHRDLAPLLDRAAATGQPGAVLEELLPSEPAYRELVSWLARLRQIRDDGGWAVITPGSTLRQGDEGPRVVALISRLRATGDLDARDRASFDQDVTVAVQRFQMRHGLQADGLVGPATLGSLNVPVQDRIDQIIVNLERWRWLPESLGDYYVIVNIAGFRLDVMENGHSIKSMGVVVGTPYRRTPVFSDRIRYLVLNPSWEVPERIAVQDKLPLIKSNPEYLAAQGYTLLQGWGDMERVIDPSAVDWTNVSARNFSYRLRQRPGPSNALGRVKFMFPNKFSVYLHDTPARELFGQNVRAFSSGCIRLESPLELAELLLAANPDWGRDAIDRAVASGQEQTVTLARPVPVHLLYWTAWIDTETGLLELRDDIYGRDEPVLRELREVPPE